MHSRSPQIAPYNSARRDAGFTLIELMITVAILGVLATVAIPAYYKYTRQAEHVEGVEAVSKIISGALAYYQSYRAMPVAPADDKYILDTNPFPDPAGFVQGMAIGPTDTDLTSFDLICGGDTTLLAKAIYDAFHSPVAKQTYVWDKLLFQPESSRIRFHLDFLGFSDHNDLFAEANAQRPRFCNDYGKGRLKVHAELRRSGDAIQKVGPYVWESI